MKAIETRYAGCRFRSRLEARWAVFFDTLGIEWEYEPEGFELPSGWYLPDFRTRTPVPPWHPLVLKSGYSYGMTDPVDPVWIEVKPELPLLPERRWIDLSYETDMDVVVLGQPPRTAGLQIVARVINGHKMHDLIPAGPALVTWWDKGLMAARSARFEHGENG